MKYLISHPNIYVLYLIPCGWDFLQSDSVIPLVSPKEIPMSNTQLK